MYRVLDNLVELSEGAKVMNKVIKFIQINFYKGKYLEALLDFLINEKPDLIAMQEVSSGCVNFCEDKTVDLFELIKEKLGFEGIFNKDFEILEPKGTFGNAVFSRFKIVDKNVLTLKEPMELPFKKLNDESFSPFIPRHLLDATVDFDDKQIHAISWHGTWTAPPTDTDETLRQANLVAGYLKSLNEPFILGGDLNATPQSKTVGIVNSVANNLMMNSSVLETTNLKIHKIAPRGFLVDYIFTSDHFKLKKLTVPQITVSDHLPIVAELEI